MQEKREISVWMINPKGVFIEFALLWLAFVLGWLVPWNFVVVFHNFMGI